MDLGECPKIHDLALRADYQAATNAKDYYYDVEVWHGNPIIDHTNIQCSYPLFTYRQRII
jgi:hypothetical protein